MDATPIPERSGVTHDIFWQEILPAARPVVMRGLVADWPAVKAGKQSPKALCDYLRRFEAGRALPTMYGPPDIGGRFFYNEDMSGFNFQQGPARLSEALDFLLEQLNVDPPHALFVQSVPTRHGLPNFEKENPTPLIGDIEPRAWIGNQIIVGAHHDPSENIACCVAGRRRFTLFPIDQLANLYIGPFEMSPAGTTVSLVDFDEPDFERFPRFKDAWASAQVADLEPGDAVYIPYFWWHHVRSLERMNMLINYWWDDFTGPGRMHPRGALLHAVLAIKSLPPRQREAWRTLFDYYVFETAGDPGAHIPADRRGVLGDMQPEFLKRIRGILRRMVDDA
ncbi:MAG TPA: cupin-like domain-containing protein [Caulobacterales bacterium]|nr:cupin-like domain-containing protein [Caulobacterales bacterium]